MKPADTLMGTRTTRIRRRALSALAAGIATAFILAPTPVSAVITLSANFDSGSLCLTPSNACSVNGTASSVSGNLVSLVGRDNFNSGDWKWMYFAASGVNGQTVTFQTGDNFETGSSSLIGHQMVYSYDQQNWSFFDNNALSTAQHKFTFSNSTPFSQNTVYVAYGLPYPYQRVADHTAGLVGSPWVKPTSSANANFVIGQSPGGIDDIGRTIAPHNLYGYEITDPNYTGAKKKIVLNSGVHANETLGDFTLEGLVDFLVSDDLKAAQLRRYADFYVYPMTNPDGRFAGYNRSTVADVNQDLNRYWDPPAYGGISEDMKIGEAMRQDTGGDIDYLVDFHSTVNGNTGHFGYILPEWQNDPFWVNVQQLEPEVQTGTALLVDLTAAKFGRDVLNAEFSATFETQYIAGENIDRFVSLGRNFGLAWAKAFNLPTDLNFDGVLDVRDWQQFMAGAEINMTGLSAIERYERGDLDEDGINSIQDFALFKQSFNQLNGQGAFAAMLLHVPEPNSFKLAMIGMLLFGVRVARPSSNSFATIFTTRSEG